MFNILKHFQTVFQSGCTILQSCQQYMRLSVLPYTCKHLLFCCFDFSYPSGCEVVSNCILLYIFMITNDVEHLFIHTMAICMSYLNKCLLKSFAHFSIQLFVFVVVELKDFSIYYRYKFLIKYVTCEHCFLSVGCIFTLLMICLAAKKILILKYNFSIVLSCHCAFVIVSKKALPNRSQSFTSILSFKNVVVLAHTLGLWSILS